MNRRRSSGSIAANPVLVGSVTTLVVVVAVFLAYNANSGLPFVPTQQLKVQMTNGANLLPGNDVREGGARIGIVDDMRPVRLPDGTAGAEIILKLDQTAGSVPADSSVTIRPRSVLGLKYVELNRGTAEKEFVDGDTIPAEQTKIPVELDEFFNINDEPTRDATRENLKGFGNAFARRGASLNRTIEGLPRLLRHLQPVATTLARADFGRMFKELGDAARVVAPAADRYAHSFTAGADTFEAWSRDEGALAQTIQKSGPTLAAGERSFVRQRPFLAAFSVFSRNLDRAAAELPSTLPALIPALREGIPLAKRSVPVNERLGDTLGALRELAFSPGTGQSLRGLNRTADVVNPLVRFLGPYITVCNYFNYSWTHVADHLSERDPTGSSQRSLVNLPPRQANSPANIGAVAPANGEQVISGNPANLHLNLYTAAVDRQGNADCESGQRGYVKRANFYGPPGQNIAVDPHIPGNQGPTFSGRPRVPKGQTFSRTPELGPQMPKELDP